MNAWTNIEISAHDSEIAEIDKFEETLGNIPTHVQQIRELITRFEVCHFKYQQHLNNIKNSILSLQLYTNPSKIGSNHIQKGENAWKNDKTGRGLTGQQYLWTLINWLADNSQVSTSEYYNNDLGQQVTQWLGYKNPDKERLVRLLIARLTYDWKSYEEFQQGGEYKELEYQICRMDICHYAFPKHLNSLLQGIGVMKPVKNLQGCSTFSNDIKTYIEKEFSILCVLLKSKAITDNSFNPDKNELIKAWLFTCLAKTLKEQVGLTRPIPMPTRFVLNNNRKTQ